MQVRWAAVLAQWLPKIKTKVTISVPWRPFYENIKAAYVDPMTSFHGGGRSCSAAEHFLCLHA